MSPFVLFLLHQTVFVYSRSNDFLTIKRHSNQNRTVDGFTVTGLYERSTCQEKCSHFKTSVVPSSNDECVCVCSPQAATFGIKNSTWQCINNRELRMRVLADCRKTYFINESDEDPLRMFEKGQRATLQVNPDIKCVSNKASLSFQAWDGELTLQNEMSAYWGLEVTRQWTGSTRRYILKINDVDNLKYLHGRVIKLTIPCNGSEKFCLLFKMAGTITCPLMNILTPKSPLPTATVEKCLPSEMIASTPDSRTLKKGVSSTIPSTRAAVATNTVFRVTESLEHNEKHDQDYTEVQEASHKLSVPLVSGVVVGAVAVFLVSFFMGWLIYRKRNDKNCRKSSKKKTRADNDMDKKTDAEGEPMYQSLSPSADGDLPRGVYVQRYKVPEAVSQRIPGKLLLHAEANGRDTFKPAVASTEEYDYAESCLMVRNKGLSIGCSSLPIKTPVMTAENDPYYHVLETEDDVLTPGSSSSDAHRIPQERAPVLLAPRDSKPTDSQRPYDDEDDEGAQVAKDTDPYYHILERSESEDHNYDNQVGSTIVAQSSQESPEPDGYRELSLEGQVYTGYQALHKYTYISAREPAVK